MKEIFITGLMCSGKTTLAEGLVNNYNFTRLPFALAVKEDISSKLRITLEELETNKGKYRSMLQIHGESMKIDDPMYWCDKWLEKKANIDNNRVVVDDMRFLNEFTFAKLRGALTIRVEVPEEVRLKRYFDKFGVLPTEEQLNHASETYVSKLPVDLVLDGEVNPKFNILHLF